MEFTDTEIRQELARLGYRDVPEEKLAEFKKDLMHLITTERSKSNSLNSSADIDDLKFDNRPVSEYRPKDIYHQKEETTKQYDDEFQARFRENWQYKGQNDATSYSYDYSHNKPNVPGSYSLYEMPQSSKVEDRFGYRYPNVNNSVQEDACSETDSEATKKLKRKTSRKTSDGSRVVDESSNASAIDLYEIYEKVKNLAMRDCECGKSRSVTSECEPPYRIKGVNKNPSVIKMGEPPHTRSLSRTLPFKRHQMYQRMWKVQPAIGDDVRYHVRKEVHSKMLQREDIKAFHKVFVPNPYVVPTEKPRYDLRWKVRKANALYEMPPHGFYHEV